MVDGKVLPLERIRGLLEGAGKEIKRERLFSSSASVSAEGQRPVLLHAQVRHENL